MTSTPAVPCLTLYPLAALAEEVNMPWEKNWGATDGNGRLRIRFPPTAYYMMQVWWQGRVQRKIRMAALMSDGC